MTHSKYIFLVIALVFLTGCAGGPKIASEMDGNKMVYHQQFPSYTPPMPAEGSLWSEASGISLFPDRRARKIGDIVVVRIVEDPEAELNANTKTSRSSSVDAATLELFGYMKALAEKNPRLAQNPGTDNLIQASLGTEFDGKGTSDRDGYLKAYISAVVEKVLFNGNLYVVGKRQVKVNNETQYITLSGIIRPEDISPTNEISSTYVADARIDYAGIGPVADKQKPGWLGRILDHVWPF
jgi:flagellar L-ring protein precursor FlgH